MRITRVYTRTGDDGSTRLAGGQQVFKDDLRIEAYGSVDETNAVIGVARSLSRELPGPIQRRIDPVFAQLQNELFNVGGELSVPPANRWEGLHLMGDAEVQQLEAWCDAFNSELQPLSEFVLPAGPPVVASLHQARTVTRRAERRLVTLIRAEPEVGTGCLVYLNRLSDLLFVLSRWVTAQLGENEVLWVKSR